MMRRHTVTSADGTRLCVSDHTPPEGQPDAPALLLIHGWSQSCLSWDRQLPLARTHRLILPDLRGHGQSDKPADPAAYDTPRPWADDIDAILTQLGATRPLLVGWSMGGLVALDYLSRHGGDRVAGLALVGCGITTGRHVPEAARQERAADSAITAQGMYGDDLGDNLDATLAFLRACFHQQPDAGDLARMMGFNMLVPPAIRAAARLRHADHRQTAAEFTKPVLLLNGAHDRAARPAMIDEAQAGFADVTRITFDGCGHAPFWEEPARFNRDLARFAASLPSTPPGPTSPPARRSPIAP